MDYPIKGAAVPSGETAAPRRQLFELDLDYLLDPGIAGQVGQDELVDAGFIGEGQQTIRASNDIRQGDFGS